MWSAFRGEVAVPFIRATMFDNGHTVFWLRRLKRYGF